MLHVRSVFFLHRSSKTVGNPISATGIPAATSSRTGRRSLLLPPLCICGSGFVEHDQIQITWKVSRKCPRAYDISDLPFVIRNANKQITFMMISFRVLMSAGSSNNNLWGRYRSPLVTPDAGRDLWKYLYRATRKNPLPSTASA